ncbi:MAG: hypothetical protein ACE366_26550 [Bradymonadia bacterium]
MNTRRIILTVLSTALAALTIGCDDIREGDPCLQRDLYEYRCGQWQSTVGTNPVYRCLPDAYDGPVLIEVDACYAGDMCEVSPDREAYRCAPDWEGERRSSSIDFD